MLHEQKNGKGEDKVLFAWTKKQSTNSARGNPASILPIFLFMKISKKPRWLLTFFTSFLQVFHDSGGEINGDKNDYDDNLFL